MTSNLWLLIAILIAIIVLGIAFFLVDKKRSQKVDYRNLFVMGAIFSAVSVPTNNNPLLILGLIFVAAGLVNFNKWEQNRTRWSDLSKEERTVKLWLMLILLLVLIVGIAIFLID